MKVTWRVDNTVITAPLEFTDGRAFAVLYQYGPKGSAEIIGQERIELDPKFLVKTNPSGVDYLYKKKITMPDPKNN